MKSVNLNFLEPSGSLQASNGTDLPYTVYITNAHQSSCNVTYSCLILMKHSFLYAFSGNTQIQILVKICPVLAEFFHADRRTDIQGC